MSNVLGLHHENHVLGDVGGHVRDALDTLADYELEITRERAARDVTIDGELLWDGISSADNADNDENDENDDSTAEESQSDDELTEEQDRWMRRFSPAGAFLRGEVNSLTWLTAGFNTEELPVYAAGSNVFLAKAPVQTAIRFAPAKTLRLAGLLWPEARQRLANSAFATIESSGNGQVILFATMPGFRGYFKGTARLLSNALIFGPGAGASQPINW